MSLCNQDCNQGRDCRCAQHYENESLEILAYAICIFIAAIVGFALGASQ